jgi:hypothetical protein
VNQTLARGVQSLEVLWKAHHFERKYNGVLQTSVTEQPTRERKIVVSEHVSLKQDEFE